MADIGGVWFFVDVLFVLALAAALIYGIMQVRRRRSPAERRATADAVRENYRRGG
jgi:flagellar biogenesis protein FliO